MYTKIIVVSLLQVVLARHVVETRPYRIHDSDRQFHFRNPDAEYIELPAPTRQVNPDFKTYTTRLDGNHRNGYNQRYVEVNRYEPYQHSSEPSVNYEIQNNQRSAIEQDYPRQSDLNNRSGDTDIRETTDHSVRSTEHRHHHQVNNNENNTPEVNKQGTLKTNLDSQPRANNDSPPNLKIERNPLSHSSNRRGPEYSARTYELTNNNTDNAKVVNESVLLLTDDVKTNQNTSTRIENATETIDSLLEVSSNSDSTFIKNPKPTKSLKTTTDNEVGYNKEKAEEDKEEKWVWGATTPATTTTTALTTMLPDGGLDNRDSFNGDGCAKGQAKVRGVCVDKH